MLAEAGTELRFDDIFADWVVANYADDPNALGTDGVYGYHLFEQAAPTVEQMFERYPVLPYTSTVSNLATDYILLKGDGAVAVNFDGQEGTRLAATQPFSGDFAWWSNRGDDLDTRLTRKFGVALTISSI